MSIVNGVKIGTLVSAANGDTYGDAERHQFRTWQALIQANVISVGSNTPPGSPTNGNTYVVGPSPVAGLWAGNANAVAYWAVDTQDGPSITPTIATGGWEFYAPQVGWEVFDNATGLTWSWNGTTWAWTTSAGTATLTASTTIAVVYSAIYTGAAAPTVQVTALSADPTALGAVWVTNSGGPNAWTGFVINAHTSGTQQFNWTATGNLG